MPMAPSNVGFRWQSGLTADVSPMSANDLGCAKTL
jgi:hypothetical protein